MIRPITFALVFAMTSVPTAAWAQPPITVIAGENVGPGTFSTVVSYKDLNLTTVEGQSALKVRARIAARQGCSGLYEGQPMEQTMQLRSSCTSASMADVTPRIDRLVQLARNGLETGSQLVLALRR